MIVRMKLFPNRDNNRIALRFAGCLVAGAALSAVFGGFVPHFTGWQAIGPIAMTLLLSFFVVPEISRQRP
jgi:hypothetical protein